MASKYRDVAEQVLRDTEAQMALVFVIGGKRGNGMSIVGAQNIPTEGLVTLLPGELRNLAQVLEMYGVAAAADLENTPLAPKESRN